MRETKAISTSRYYWGHNDCETKTCNFKAPSKDQIWNNVVLCCRNRSFRYKGEKWRKKSAAWWSSILTGKWHFLIPSNKNIFKYCYTVLKYFPSTVYWDFPIGELPSTSSVLLWDRHCHCLLFWHHFTAFHYILIFLSLFMCCSTLLISLIVFFLIWTPLSVLRHT